jgi:hypothetical protein
MQIKIDTTNLIVVQNWFKTLPEKEQKNIWMSAFRKAAKPMVQTAQAFIPYKSKESAFGGSTRQPSYGLHFSMGVIPYPSHTALWIGSKVSTHTTRGDKLWHVFYGRLVEWGHRKRGKRIAGRNVPGSGMVQGTHFFENAVNATYGEVLDSVNNEWVAAIDRWGERVKRKLKKIK